MLGDFILEVVTSIGSGLTITLPNLAPAGRLTWASRFGAVRQPVYYVLDDTVQEEWGVGTWIPGAPNTLTRDLVINNSAGTTARLNFAGTTRCYNAPPSAFLWNVLGSNVGRNLLHNPLFRINQRGIGAWTTGGYTSDRWLAFVGTGGGTRSWSVFAQVAPSASWGDEAVANYLACTFSGGAAAGDTDALFQRLEDVRRLSGKTVTASFWANSSAGTPKVGVNIQQVFGTGGAPSVGAYALATGASVTLSTVPTRYSVTIPMPSIIGKTLGTTLGTDYNQLALFLSSGATNNAIAGNIGVQAATVSFWGMQCEIAPAASPLEKPDPQQDLAKCQRFFFASDILGTGKAGMFGYNSAAASVFTDVPYPVTMRAAPSIATSSIVYANASGLTAQTVNNDHTRFMISATALGACNATFYFTATADL
jgi:hypothetical protein